jgi:hypothetical protein
MTLILIIFCIWGVSALVKAANAKRQQRELERIKAEQNRQRAEQAEQRQQRNEEIRQRIEQQRELLRLAKAEREQAEWNRKQEEINRRQEEHNRRTDERLMKIEQKLELAKRDEEHWSELFDQYDVDLSGEQAALNYMKSNPLLRGQIEKQQRIVDKLSKQRYDAETKLIKARQQRELAEREMEVA